MNLTEAEAQELLKTHTEDKSHDHRGNPMTAIAKLPPEKIKKLRKEIGLPKESEDDFASWFEDFLHAKGYKYAHFRPARVMRNGKEIYETPVSGDAAGLEDYFVWHEEYKPKFDYGHCFFWAELKSEKGKLSEKQAAIIESHQKAGLRVFVFRPSDRFLIERLLG